MVGALVPDAVAAPDARDDSRGPLAWLRAS